MEEVHKDTIQIIMASYNGMKYIREQIDSIFRSTCHNWVLSIYDDGSTDETIDIIKAYVDQYPEKIELHQNETNQGVVQNFLQGIIDCPYSYVMFCDQDDVWKEDKIEQTYQYMVSLENKYTGKMPLAVFTDATVVDETLKEISPSFHQSGKLDTSHTQLNYILMENKMIGCTCMINRPLIEKLQVLPKAARYHDWWIAIVAASFGKLEYLPMATLNYRQHGHNVVGNVSFGEYIKQRIGSLGRQKEALLLTMKQARNFYELYASDLSKEAKEVIGAFMTLEDKNWLVRRYMVVKYHFYKTGWIRNLGIFIII